MNIQLLQAIMPTSESSKLMKQLNTGMNGESGRRLNSLKLVELIFKISIQTAEALEQCQFKKFDALVRNFGCQITAAELFLLLKDGKKEICREANRIKIRAIDALKKIDQEKVYLKECPKVSDKVQTFSKYMQSVAKKRKITFDSPSVISLKVGTLVRLRLLTIINSVDTNEKPFTDISKLNDLVKDLPRKYCKNLVKDIQIEESLRAADFVRDLARELFRGAIDAPQIKLTSRCLEDDFRCSASGIQSLPLAYNTETALKAVNGIVLIKNKLFYAGQRIDGARPFSALLSMSQEIVLSERNIKELGDEQPIVVIEAYVYNSVALLELIKTEGLVKLIKMNCAKLNQYAGSSKCITDIDNCDRKVGEEAEEEMELLRIKDAELGFEKNIFQVDHIYCASVKEELRGLEE